MAVTRSKIISLAIAVAIPGPSHALTATTISMSENTSSYTSALHWQSTTIAGDTQKMLDRVVSASTGTDSYVDALKTAPIVVAWDTAGKLPHDPSLSGVLPARTALGRLVTASMCARYAQHSSIAKKCAGSASLYIRKWLKDSIPTGNPINDFNYVNLFLSLDLMLPIMNERDVANARAWLRELIQKETTFMNSLRPTDDRLKNNWMTWRLANRSLAGAIIGDKLLNAETKTLLEQHVKQNLAPPAGWSSKAATPTPGDPNCRNPTSISEFNYGGFDFRQRDSLTYHVFNLEAFALIQSLTDLTIDQADTAIINRAYDFLELYVSGEKTHLDWKCTSVQLDIDRRKTGESDYQIANFNVNHFRHQIRLFRLAYPAAKTWSENFVTTDYAPWEKLWFALRGEAVPH